MYVIGCDVGTGSVRAAIIQFNGDTIGDNTIAVAEKAITVYNPSLDHYEQNSAEIWDAVCYCVRECVESAKIDSSSIAGIAFSATCSLVIVHNNHKECPNDIIMWMDHRAVSQASHITASNHSVLQQFGGVCSPEFTLAKLVWLRQHQRQRFDSTLAFMELPDWLTWKCMDDSVLSFAHFPRSLCSVTCKWGYDAEQHQWSDELFELIGLSEFVSDKSKIGDTIVAPGKRIGFMSGKVAKQFGLNATESDRTSISVSSPIIDAHSGVLAMLAFSSQLNASKSDDHQYDTTFCMIAGTSTCHMVSTRERHFTYGVWGPYLDVIFPGYYVREAGQSATGKLIEHMIVTHPEWERKYKHTPIESIIKELNDQILKENRYMNKLHVNPCFHGNRSPLANPLLRGGVYGLTLEANSLLDCYHATIEALTYETKFILDELRVSNLQSVLMSGGLAKNDVYMQTHADVLNTEVITFGVGNANLMLVGTAILARQSALDRDLTNVQLNYPQLNAKRYTPSKHVQKYHNLKYKCYRELLNSAIMIDNIMKDV